MLISLLGTLSGLIVLALSGLHVFMEQTVNWIAYASIGAIAFFASVGISSLVPVVITEMMPTQVSKHLTLVFRIENIIRSNLVIYLYRAFNANNSRNWYRNDRMFLNINDIILNLYRINFYF